MEITKPEVIKGSAKFKLRECGKDIVDFIDAKILGIKWENKALVPIEGGIFKDTKIEFKRVDTSRYIAAGYRGQYCNKRYDIAWGIDPEIDYPQFCFELTVQERGSKGKSISNELVEKINALLVEYVSN